MSNNEKMTDLELETFIKECVSDELTPNTIREIRLAMKDLIQRETIRCHNIALAAVHDIG